MDCDSSGCSGIATGCFARFGVVSEDRWLVRALEGAIAPLEGQLAVARDPGEAASLLESRDLSALVLDGRSSSFGSIGKLVGPDSLLLVRRGSRPGAGRSTFQSFDWADAALLIDCIERLARGAGSGCEGLLGWSPAMTTLRERIARLARFPDVSVLVRGETGTGKELVACAIHRATHGDAHPFVAINCAAIPEALLESELFGHEAGAFTGARGVRRGLFEEAHAGTVFLDEIGEMPIQMQPKLLRVLESRTFRRVGSNTVLPLRARVVSATNRLGETHAGLRPDLFYRLASTQIVLPSLRERREDVPLLASHFLDAFTERYGAPPATLCPAAMTALCGHAWPGNVRELRAVVEQAAIGAAARTIGVEDVRGLLSPGEAADPYPGESASPSAKMRAAGAGLRDVERELVLDAYKRHQGNVSRTACELSIPRSTLRGMLRRLGALPREPLDG